MLAVNDPLTGCFNRRHFLDRAERQLSAARLHKWPVSLLTMDIDQFNTINDGFGQAAGDQALRALSGCCLDVLRVDDAFARIGGAEFAVLLTDTDEPAALMVADRLRTAVEDLVVALPWKGGGPQALRMTICVGVATIQRGEEGLDMLMARADLALHQAREEGGNRVLAAAAPSEMATSS